MSNIYVAVISEDCQNRIGVFATEKQAQDWAMKELADLLQEAGEPDSADEISRAVDYDHAVSILCESYLGEESVDVTIDVADITEDVSVTQ